MTETVSSRSWLTFFGASVFLVGAALALCLPAPWWAQVVGVVFGTMGLGLAYRLFRPVDATLYVDDTGISWDLDAKPVLGIRWEDIRSVHQTEDGTIYFEVGGFLARHIPGNFLRNPEQKAQFLALVAAARPDVPIER